MQLASLLAVDPMMFYPSMVSAGISWAIASTKHLHGKYTLDHHEGVQKFHALPTPRIGGLALFLALIAAHMIAGSSTGGLLGLMILASIPAFAAGILEDMTRKVGVRERLLATMVSGALACMLTGVHLDHVDVPFFDRLLSVVVVAVVFTSFAVGGVANSINIIDGFNGLAGGVLMICFGMLGTIAWQVGDIQLVNLCLLLAVAVAGFLLLNFPYGKIFMGDGGAYLMGFMLAWIAVLLPMRNPSVSPWASIVACSYPIIETIYSMIRRTITRAGSGNPDSAHLHSLIKVKLIRRYFSHQPQQVRNALVSPLCWLVTMLLAIPALYLYRNSAQLMLVFAGGFLFYVFMYYLISSLKAR
ncbi:MAG: glycosyl transferase [Chlorobiaceae bacterium]|nr:glycosyl transferase [Chlorobiaceae bacterium]